MNREQRRRQQRARRREHRATPLVHALADRYECPDCLADTELLHEAPGLYRLKVMHDDTCPTYRAMRRTS